MAEKRDIDFIENIALFSDVQPERFAALSDGELDGVERLVDVVDVDDGVDTVDDCFDFAFLVFLGVMYPVSIVWDAVATTMRGAFLIFGIV